MTTTARPGSAPAPAWLLAPEPGRPDCTPSGRRMRRSFLARTLAAGAALAHRALTADPATAADPTAGRPPRPALLRRLDPRAKLLALAVLLVGVGLLRSLAALAAAYLLTLGLALAGGMPLGSYLRRVWLAVPAFTGVALAPATLSIVTPGQVLLPLWTWQGTTHGITAPGLSTAALVLLRVATSVSLVLLVTATTGWTRLLAALRVLRVPAVFVMVIGMAHRYVLLLLRVVVDLAEARTARTLGPTRHDAAARGFLGATAGTLLGTAHRMAEDVHDAMLARGWAGTPRTLDDARLAPADVLAVAASVLLAAALLGAEHLRG